MAHHGCLPLFAVLLHFVLSADIRHECDRPCVKDEQQKICFYKFNIGISRRASSSKENEDSKYFLSINGKRPGPTISVCQNDTLIVEVSNQLPAGMETSLHWHGFSLENNPYMDGVPMITQCPILPHTRFRYAVKATKPGTFYYRAHSVPQQLDGIFGALIVHNQDEEAYRNTIVILSPQMKNPQALESNFIANLNVTGLRVDILNDTNDKNVENDNLFKLRIINAGAVDCPVRLFTHTVPLRVVAIDGNDVKPTNVNEILVNPGERLDLLVKPEVTKVTHIIGHRMCQGFAQYGFYSGVTEKVAIKMESQVPNLNGASPEFQLEKPEKLEKSDLSVFLPFDASVFEDFKGDVDFRYKLGAVTTSTPSVLSLNSISIMQFGNKSFLYPSTPVLSQPEEFFESMTCDLRELSTDCQSNDNGFCECLQTVKLPYNKNVDLFLIDEGKNGNISQTIYIHGHSFFVLATKFYDKPISGKEIEEKEALGLIEKNLVNPLKKNTVSVPNKGYVVLRLKSDNPGKWLIESIASKASTGMGLELILNVDNPDGHQAAPKDFPTCRSMKEPDLVFGMD